MIIDRARNVLGERVYHFLAAKFQKHWENTPPGERRSSRRVALAAFVQEHFSQRIIATAQHDDSSERQHHELTAIKRDIEGLHSYGETGRSDSLTAAFGFFGDALFGTSDKEVTARAAAATLDTVIAKLDGIEAGTRGGMNGHTPLRDLEHKLSDQFSAHSERRSGVAEEPPNRRNQIPSPPGMDRNP